MFDQLRAFCNDVSAEAGHILWRLRTVLIWLTPVVVAFLAHRFSEHRQVTIVGAVIAVFALVYLVQRPGIALVALAVFLPLQGVSFGLLLNLHAPASTLHEASGLKELLGVALLGAAIRRLRDGDQVLDRIDRALLAYVAVVTLYLIIPHLFSTGAPSSFSPRIVAWRADCGYPLLFFAVRHAGIKETQKKRFVQVVLGVGWIIVLCGLYQRIAPNSWSHFMLIRAKQPQFLVNVNHLQPLAAQQSLHFLANPHPLQVSSIFISPYDMADYLLLVVGITAARIIRDHRSAWNWILLAGTIAVLFFSRVRADSLGALLVLGVALLPAPRRPVEARVRLILGLVIGAAILIPSLGGTRFVGAQGGSQSNHGHLGEFIHGISVAVAHPLGLGIGDQAATATKYQAETGLPPSTLLSSGSIAQVSDELGIQALIPWLLTMGFIFYELRRRAREPDDLITGVGLGLLGLFIAAQFHHAFITYPGPWTFFAAIALALPGAAPTASTVTGDRHPARVAV